jgi:hypothetical protein
MPIVAGSNSLSTEDWLAVSKHMNISLVLDCERPQFGQGADFAQADFGSAIHEVGRRLPDSELARESR